MHQHPGGQIRGEALRVARTAGQLRSGRPPARRASASAASPRGGNQGALHRRGPPHNRDFLTAKTQDLLLEATTQRINSGRRDQEGAWCRGWGVLTGGKAEPTPRPCASRGASRTACRPRPQCPSPPQAGWQAGPGAPPTPTALGQAAPPHCCLLSVPLPDQTHEPTWRQTSSLQGHDTRHMARPMAAPWPAFAGWPSPRPGPAWSSLREVRPCPQAWPGAAWQPDRAGAAAETEPGVGLRNTVPEDGVPPTQGLVPPRRLAVPRGQHAHRRGNQRGYWGPSGGPQLPGQRGLQSRLGRQTPARAHPDRAHLASRAHGAELRVPQVSPRGTAGVCGESCADAGAPPARVLLRLEKGRLGGEPGMPRPVTHSRLHEQHLIPILKCL